MPIQEHLMIFVVLQGTVFLAALLAMRLHHPQVKPVPLVNRSRHPLHRP